MSLHRVDRLAKYTVNMVNPKNDSEAVIKLRGVYYLAVKKTMSDGFSEHDYLELYSISPCVHAQMMIRWEKAK